MNRIKADEANKCLEICPRAQEEDSSIPLSGGWSLEFGCKPRLSTTVTWGQSRHVGHRGQTPETVNDRRTSIYACDLLLDVFHFLIQVRCM
jgi:hypothetical protein